MKTPIYFILFFLTVFSIRLISQSSNIPLADRRTLCNMDQFINRGKTPQEKQLREDLFLKMVGALELLAGYRKSFLTKGGLIDLFPTAYYHTTLAEMKNIVDEHSTYKYPIEKMHQMLAFFDAYQDNRLLWGASKKGLVEEHWRIHFDQAESTLYNDINPACLGIGVVLGSGIDAHVKYDLPRAIRYAYENRSNQSLSKQALEYDFNQTDEIFPKTNEKTKIDIAYIRNCSKYMQDIGEDIFAKELGLFNSDGDVVDMRRDAWDEAYSGQPIKGKNGNNLKPQPLTDHNKLLSSIGDVCDLTVPNGTTIITHGYQAPEVAPIAAGEWMGMMANAIIELKGKGQVLRYNKSSGRYDQIYSKGKAGETILLFDWAKESNNDYKGYSEAAGDALFSSLILGAKRGDFSLKELHFIGHSRGTVVNTLAVERLIVLKNSYPNTTAISIDQVTNIDPHDWGFLNKASDLDDAHKDISIGIPPNNIPNNGTIAWAGIFSDTYYQTNPSLIGEVNLHGRPVLGTMNFEWTENDQGTVLKHGGINGIHLLGYLRTITEGVKIKSSGGAEGGYHLARLGGEAFIRPTSIAGTNQPTFNFFNENENEDVGIVNGSFNRGEDFEIPGWLEHNGANQTRRSKIINGELNINAYPNKPGSITHNRFYIPKDAKFINFDHKYNSDYPGKLSVLINGLSESDQDFDKREDKFRMKCVDVSKYQGQVVTLTFQLNNTGPVFSDIFIDNVQLSMTGCSYNSTLFLFDLSGSMNDHGGGSIPKIEQAKQASKTTINGMRTSNPGLTNQVAVYGFRGACMENPTIQISDFDTDLNTIEQRIDLMSAGGGTPLGQAIRVAECEMAAHLQKEGQQKGKLIILSDGQGTCGNIRPNGVYNSAPLQKNRSVMVDANQCGLAGNTTAAVSYYTVGFNIAPGSPAERDLQYLSQLSGGKYLNVQNQTQLVRAFRKFNRVYIPKENPARSNHSSDAVNEFRKGVTQVKEEYFEEALDLYTTFVEKHPQDCHAVYNLALMQEANDYYKEAIDNYRKYLNMCSRASNKQLVEKQIKNLEEELREFLMFQREVVKSDLEFLNLHFKKIQNGQSVALASEFKGFLMEKDNYYQKLPRLLGNNEIEITELCKEMVFSFQQCKLLIRRNPQKWDQDAIPIISMAYLNLEELLEIL